MKEIVKSEIGPREPGDKIIALPRRQFLALLGAGGLGTFLGGVESPARIAEAADGSHGASGGMDPDEALKKLTAGNQRYAAQKARHPNQTTRHRVETAKGQHPFAAILGCADSRVPPEIIFDQGLGDLFVVRVAGNIADDAGIGSIEYAVEHLGARLIMVLGHEKCGAVSAAIEVSEKGGPTPGHLPSVVNPILPAVHKVKMQPGSLLENAVRANVRLVVDRLRSSVPVLKPLADGGKIKLVGGRYDLSSGAVEVIP